MKKLFSYHISWGRGFGVEGIFIAEQKEVDNIIGKNINFGEICGKHSDIRHTFEKGQIGLIKVSQSTVDDLYEQFGETISGYNPLEYYDDEKDTHINYFV